MPCGGVRSTVLESVRLSFPAGRRSCRDPSRSKPDAGAAFDPLAAELSLRRQPLALMVSLEMLAFTGTEQRYPLPALRWLYGRRADFIAVIGNLKALPQLPGLTHRLGQHVRTQQPQRPARWRRTR